MNKHVALSSRADELLELVILSRQFSHIMNQQLVESGLNFNHWQLLFLLSKKVVSTPMQIANYLHIEPATVSQYLERLEGLKLLKRVYNQPDRRNTAIILLPAAKSYITQGLEGLVEISNQPR
ncbi:MarR family transcriptional regulator [Gammaproteobacteria bacterium]|nr:MarR family transcriptional regulator [Gammaproteobacteria bacterium]